MFPILFNGNSLIGVDTFFNWRCTEFIKQNGIIAFIDWYDNTVWYPQGREIGRTSYPGLMLTCVIIHHTFSKFHLFISLKTICAFIGPFFAIAFPIISFFISRTIFKKDSLGLLCAIFSSTVVNIASTNLLGMFDNESISIAILTTSLYAFLKGSKTGSIYYMLLNAFAYGYLSLTSGSYIFLVNLFPFLVVCSILFGYYSYNVYFSYNVWYIFGTLISALLPYVDNKILLSSEHFLSNIVFGGIQIYTFLFLLYRNASTKTFNTIFLTISLLAIICLSYSFRLPSFSGRVQRIFFPFGKIKDEKMLGSVYEHLPSSWSTYFISIGPIFYMFPVGIHILIKQKNMNSVFILIASILSFYFSSLMIRNINFFAIPSVIVSSIAINDMLEKSFKKRGFISLLTVLLMFFLCILQNNHSIHCISNISRENFLTPEIETNQGIQSADDYNEAFSWIRENTELSSKIMASWDLGFFISALTNRTVYSDGNTNNFTHLNVQSLFFASSEKKAWGIGRSLDVDYILVVFGGASGYSNDYIGKAYSLLDCLPHTFPNISVEKYFSSESPFIVSSNTTQKASKSMFFRLSNYNFQHFELKKNVTKGTDTARGFIVNQLDFSLSRFEEVFTSKNWIIRIYKVLQDQLWDN